MAESLGGGLGQVIDAIGSSENVLLCGAGGGHDIVSGVPLWWHLRAKGARVHLANLSFTTLDSTGLAPVDPTGICYPVGPEATGMGEIIGQMSYPELHLARWLARDGVDDPVVWSFGKAGIAGHSASLAWLAEHLAIDAVVMVDGGNDSLMGGWEHGVGSAVEDVTSIVAGAALPVDVKLLVCAGLGTDIRHGVGLADTLQAIAELTAAGAWRGVCGLLPSDPGVVAMLDVVAAINGAQDGRSTVANAVVAAVEGRFGNVEVGTTGGADSTVWVNPLYAMYWAFDLDAVAARLAYPAEIQATSSWNETMRAVLDHRRRTGIRAAQRIPM
jgi:hypothetical protein